MINFDEATHTYNLKGKKLISVTQLFEKFFHFDKEGIAEKLSIKHKISKDKILESWKLSGEMASVRGTYVHKVAEDIFLGKEVDVSNNPEGQQVVNFFEDRKHLLKVRSEMVVFNEEWGLAGTIDLVMMDTEGNLYIFDWKTSNKIVKTSHYKLPRPLHDLDDCNLVHYSLQLNAYKLLLSNFLKAPVVYLGIVHLSPSEEKYELVEALPLESTVLQLLEKRKSRLSVSNTPNT